MRKIAVTVLLALGACRDELAEAPLPVTMTEDALSHFCQMNVSEHPGPKGQIHLAGMPGPIFFAQVRDMLAYLKSPERDAKILAVYVSDMGTASSWHSVAPDNWIAAVDAVFVINAGVAGGMGAPEVVPFATSVEAEVFTAEYGGRIVPFDEIPDDVALGPIDMDAELVDPA